MLATALVPISMLLANVATFATQLLVPRFLSPGDYATFAVLWATGQFVASASFEWARLSVLRFSVAKDAERTAANRQALLRCYTVIALGLCAAAGATMLFGRQAPLLATVAAISFYAACQGSFEGRQALARAEFENGRFSAAWLARTALSLVGVVGMAMLTHSGTGALIGLALSYPLSLLAFNLRGLGRLRQALRRADQRALRFLAGYGIFAATSTIASNFLPAAVRMLAAQVLPLAVAGGMLLALDLSQKALLVIGLAVNLIVMQNSIRAAEFGTPAEHAAQIARQVSVPFALIAPAALGFYLVQPSFAAVAVPAAYRAGYLANIGWATMSAALLAARLFSVDPLFLAAGRSKLSVIGPAVSLVVTFSFVGLVGRLHGYSDILVSSGTALGLAVGLAAAATAAARLMRIRWPLKDMAFALIACAGMAAVLSAFPRMMGLVGLGSAILLAGLCYGAVALVLDLCGMRAMVRTRLARRRAVA